ncbi:MAG TPA: carboxypeptidase-like regulatory domain-containing protein [Pyrinomonadaceae bacterium]|nr:carboxypeptidase-like regulatory domain-containing protein [Pyrinomonadaceae bacterium]
MLLQRLIGAFLLTMLLLTASAAAAQKDSTTGSIKGKVRDDKGAVEGVEVIASQSDSEVRRAVTNRKGEFLIAGLAPGFYGLTFRKPGLSVGRLERVEVRAGKVRSLPDRLYLRIDEGSIAFIRGSVFTAEGKSVPNARVELARIQPDGSAKKIDGRITNETGLFVFRLVPDTAKYRISVWAGDTGPITKDVEVDGPARYNIALQLPAR